MRFLLWAAPLLVVEVAGFTHFPRQTTTLPTAIPSPPSSNPTQGLLVPSIYDTDLTDFHNLDPQKDLQVYYEEGGDGTHAAFVAFTDLKHPTVVLEHSSYINNVTCNGDAINLEFSDPSALAYALEAWSTAISEGIIFITNCASCSYGYPAERGWLLVSDVRQEGLSSIVCDFTEALASEVTKTVAVSFGQIGPGGNPAKSKRSSKHVNPDELSKRSKCNADNCFNAISGGGSTGVSFCSSFLATTQTQTASTSTSTSTPLGPYASKCSNLPSRISSACSCLVTVSSSSLSSSKTFNLAGSSSSSSTKSTFSTLTGKLTSSTSSQKSSSSSKSTTSSSSRVSSSTSTGTMTLKSSLSASKLSSFTSSTKASSTVSASTSTVAPKSSSSISKFSSLTYSTKISSNGFTQSSSKLSSSPTKVTSSVASSKSSVLITSSSKPQSSSSSKASSPVSLTKLTSSTSHTVSSSSSSKIPSQTIVGTSKTTSAIQTVNLPPPSTTKISFSSTSVIKLVTSPSSSKSSTSIHPQTTTSPAIITSAPPTIQDFDTTLDNALGYLNSSAPGFWSQLLPGVPVSDIPGFGPFRLRARTWDVTNIVNALHTAVSGVVGAALNPTDAIYQTASDAISAAVANAITEAVQILNSLSPFSLGPFPFSAGPTPTAKSDFGSGIILTQSSGKSPQGLAGTLTTYCIGCIATGSFSVTGSVIFDAQEGITSAIFDLVGNIQAQIEIALVASITTSASQQQNIITQGLPALTIPGFLVIGPAISLDVGATVAIQAVGGLAAGYQFSWPSVTAHFDILDDIYNVAGFTPITTPIFDYEGKVSAQASLYGLISLTFGVDIMKGKYKANVGLVDKPEVDSTIAIQVYSDYQLSQLADGTVICVGEQFTISAKDSVYADVVYGGIANKSSTKTWPLTSWAAPTFTTCFGSLSTVHHSNSSSTSTTPSTTSASITHSATPSLPAIGSCDPIAAYTGWWWHSCIHIPDPSDSAAVANFISYMEFEGLETGEGQADSCREFSPTKTQELACIESIQAQIPPAINETNPCPEIQNGSATQANLEAVICHGEIAWWAQFQAGWNAFWALQPTTKRDDSKALSLSARDLEEWEMPDVGSRKRVLGVTVSTAGDIFNTTTHLAWSADGNVVASVNGTRFISVGGYFVGDGEARLLHLYQDEVNALGVSRLRLATLDTMPVGSVLVSLTPLALPSTAPHSIFAAFTSAGNMYYLVTCIIEGQLPKIFLVEDPVAGIAILMSPAQQSTITGGVVDMCGLLRWGN